MPSPARAASVGLPATIFVPRRAPAPKVAQLRAFGATVLRVDADYDTTWELCAAAVEEVGRRGQERWFNRNCAVNPYLVEGKKTVALELAEQLGAAMPSWVSLSVGDGCTVEKALAEVARVRGAWIAVSDAEILAAIPLTASLSGVFAEPAAAAATAGVLAARASGLLGPEDEVAIIVSGNGLKDPMAALGAVGGPIDVAPDLGAVRAALGL